MFIRIGEFSDLTYPVVSVVRLKPLDQCDLFALDAFEQGRNLSSKVIWALTNRKLQALIDGFGIENNKSDHKVVESRAEWLDNLTCIDRKVFNGIRKFIAQTARVSWMWLRDDDIVLEFPEFFYSNFEIRQAFFGPLYSTVGVVQ
jgi:hypothetical protein